MPNPKPATVRLTTYLTPDQARRLEELTIVLKYDEGKNTSVTELIRDAVDMYLAKVDRKGGK